MCFSDFLRFSVGEGLVHSQASFVQFFVVEVFHLSIMVD